MKVFLTRRDISVEGYKNLDISDLDNISDGECYNMYMDDMLINSFAFNDFEYEFTRIIKKIAIGGSIIINGIDIKLFARDIIWENITNDQIQGIIYNISSAITWNEVVSFINKYNFKTKRVELNGSSFILEAIREN